MTPDDAIHPTASDEYLLVPEEVRERLKIGRTKFELMIREGQLKVVWLGGVRRIPKTALDQFLASLPTNADRRVTRSTCTAADEDTTGLASRSDSRTVAKRRVAKAPDPRATPTNPTRETS